MHFSLAHLYETKPSKPSEGLPRGASKKSLEKGAPDITLPSLQIYLNKHNIKKEQGKRKKEKG